MAIIVSNPSLVAINGNGADLADTPVLPSESGFPAELKLAMDQDALAAQTESKDPEDSTAPAQSDAANLQILPATALLQAVVDANFAPRPVPVSQLPAQQSLAPVDPQAVVLNAGAVTDVHPDTAAMQQIPQVSSLQSPLTAVNLLPGLSGASSPQDAPADASALPVQPSAAMAQNLAGSQPLNPPGSAAPDLAQSAPQTNAQVLEAVASAPAPAPQPSLATVLAADSPVQVVPSSPQQQAAQAMNPGSFLTQFAPSSNSASQEPSSHALEETSNAVAGPETAVPGDADPWPSTAPVARALADVSVPVSSNTPFSQAVVSSAPLSPEPMILGQRPATETSSPTKAGQGNQSSIAPLSEQIVATEEASRAILLEQAYMPVGSPQILGQSSSASELTERTAAASPPVPSGDSAFQFDAKLGAGTDTPPMQASSAKGVPTQSALLPADGRLAGADRTASLVQSDQMSVPVTSDASEPSRAQTEVARALAEPQAPKSQIASDTSSLSFDEVSSSFVSSLVGGAARPVETVMDWISLQPMERPAPLAPHQVRLDAGAVQVEIQRMVRQGGGQVVMELTPPDQSKFTIELRLDDKGGASLVVEGVSDSTRARLEQSAPQLHQQFEQMGLSLQLDMRQQRDTMSSSDRQGQEGSAAAADHKNADVKGLAVESRNRQRALSEGQIHLYA